MAAVVYTYPVTIKEVYLDSFGHVNNAVYLTLFEEARWDFTNKNGFGIKQIKELGIGPVLLEVNIKYLKELKVREEIIIESQIMSYKEKILKLSQKMLRNGEVCCDAEFTIALVNWKDRKLILPIPEWLKAIGVKA